MKHATLSAIFAISLLLSQDAPGADVESAKGPLTADEKTQCRAQLTEFNQGVRAYNAELETLKGLESEIDTLRAELDKEQAAVDRRDSAAMKALNARIGKNNEMVELYEKMSASITAMSTENKQRSAQLREACENRPAALPSPAPKPTAAAACSSAAGAKDVERQIEATFVVMRADEKERQAELDRVVQARGKAQGWSDDKRGKVFLELLGSPKFLAFEREKQPYLRELMSLLGSKPKNGQEECRLVQRVAATLPAIKAINARQYTFMADHIRSAK